MPPINEGPYEVIAGPVTLYLAPVGTAKPDVGVAPSAPWSKVGKQGARNYFEDGVVMTLSQETQAFRPLGSTYVRKVFRVAEGTSVKVKVADVSLETLALALNHNTVASAGGVKSINLKRGFGMAQRALLVEGPSAEGNGLTRHIHLNVAVQTGSQEITNSKGEPQGLELEWMALEDDDGNVGSAYDEEEPT